MSVLEFIRVIEGRQYRQFIAICEGCQWEGVTRVIRHDAEYDIRGHQERHQA